MEKVNMESMEQNLIRCMPIAQYVACFKLNFVDRPESLKKLENQVPLCCNAESKNTYNEWHDFGDGTLYIKIKT